jgi:hypothetical protein
VGLLGWAACRCATLRQIELPLHFDIAARRLVRVLFENPVEAVIVECVSVRPVVLVVVRFARGQPLVQGGGERRGLPAVVASWSPSKAYSIELDRGDHRAAASTAQLFLA